MNKDKKNVLFILNTDMDHDQLERLKDSVKRKRKLDFGFLVNQLIYVLGAEKFRYMKIDKISNGDQPIIYYIGHKK